jgi:hypothetical protein
MLDSDQIRSDKRDMIDLFKNADNTAVIDTRNEDRKEISQQIWLLLKIEG